MPATKLELLQVAVQIADQISQQPDGLQPELHDIEARKKLAHERRKHFRPEIRGRFQCPLCWIRNETRSSLIPIPSDRPKLASFPSYERDNWFECLVCNSFAASIQS
jgi:hypothetical protein